MKGLTTAKQVLLGFLLVTLGAAVVAVAGATAIKAMENSITDLIKIEAVVRTQGEARENTLEVRRFEKDFVIAAGDPVAQRESLEKWRSSMQRLLKNIDALMSKEETATQRDALKRLKESIARYSKGFEEMAAAARAKSSLSTTDLSHRLTPYKDDIRAVVEVLDNESEQHLIEERKTAEAATNEQARSTQLLYVALALVFIAAVAISGLVSSRVSRTVRNLISEAARLRQAVAAGKLNERGDTSRLSAEFQPVLVGMNETMDAFSVPIAMTTKALDRISKGDIPPKITEAYQGDFNTIKDNLNQCIDAVNLLVADANQLSKAAVEGKLSTRADASRHQGDFRKVVQGVNDTLDAVIAPVKEAADVLNVLAQRDLRGRMKGNYQGDHAKLKESLNSTATALHDALGQVAESVEQVSSASNQIASSSQAVASGASQQASSIEETSASLESMTATTKQSADNAHQANTLAQLAKSSASDGTVAMAQMQGAMEKIRASAEGTSQIIKDINEIAFQTNLLALNAAVEAARAGEAGRGFAVVAEEVRSLALRSKEAASKTEERIQQSVKEAEEGTSASKHVNDKLSEIAQSIGKVSDIVAEIAAASKEQANGIQQVTKAIAEMEKVTQQNAASSEESSSAAEELSSQSEELAAMVGSFRIERNGARASSANLIAPKTSSKSSPPSSVKSSKNGTNGVHTNPGFPLRPEELIPFDGALAMKEF